MENQAEEKKLKIMRKEIRQIAKYHALIISRYYMTVCLAISFLLLAFVGFTESALYILLILNLMPSILSYILHDASTKRNSKFLLSLVSDDSFIFTSLKRKYHYSNLKYITNQVSFTVTLLLLLLWQYNYITKGGIQSNFTYLPTVILVSSVALRILCTLIYLWKLPNDLKNNRT